MPTINFTMFVDKVESGEKRQTIRAIRKRPIKVGDKLYLYTCLRTTGCRSLLNSDYWTKGQGIYEMTVNDSTGESYVTCREVHDIEMYREIEKSEAWRYCRIKLDGDLLELPYMKKICRDDGFDRLPTMFDWFEETHGLPFKGQLIKW